MTAGPDARARPFAFRRRFFGGMCLVASQSLLLSAAETCRENAVLQIERGDNPAALHALEACPSPASDEERTVSARLQFLSGNLASAAALLKESDEDPLSLLTRAQILAGLDRNQEALSLYDRLLTTAPWRPMVFLLRGKVLERLGMLKDAESSYQSAINEDASFAEARPLLALLQERQGRTEDAWKQWDRVAAASPDAPTAKAALARLTPKLPRPPEQILPVARLPNHRGAPCPPEAWRGPRLRIGIAVDGKGRPLPLKEAVIRASSPFTAATPQGRVLAKGSPGERWTIRAASRTLTLSGPDGLEKARFDGPISLSMENPAANTFIVDGLAYAAGFVWSGAADKELRGDLNVSVGNQGLKLAAVMPMEAYLYGVVGAEMPPTWPSEALQTQAVVARTYAAARRIAHPHGKDGYDLCDEQHCQVYAGASREAAAVRAAVDATRGKILSFQGKPAQTFYASNCGGHGRSVKEVWGGTVSYLAGQTEEGVPVESAWDFRRWLMSSPAISCKTSPFVPAAHHRWARVFELTAGEKPSIHQRGGAGHVTEIRLGTVPLTTDAKIRRFLGEGPLRSSLYTVEVETIDGKPVRAYVFGGGWGHGVGLCQAGASGRAAAGEPHQAILSHYFPGTTLTDLE